MLKFVEDINNLSVGTVLNEYEDAYIEDVHYFKLRKNNDIQIWGLDDKHWKNELNNVGNEMHPKASFKSLMQALRHGLIWNHIDEDKT